MKKILLGIVLLLAVGFSQRAFAEDFWVYVKAADEIGTTSQIAGLSQKGDIVDVIPCARSTGTPATPGYFIMKVSDITEAQRREMLKPYTETKTETIDGVERQVEKPLAYRKNKVDLEALKTDLKVGSKTSVLTTATAVSKIATTEKTAATLEAYQKEARLYELTMPVRVAKKTILDLILPKAYAASITRYVNTASSGGDGTTNNTSGATAAFATLNVAEDTMDGTAFGAGETATINCSGSTADTTAVTFSGWDADVTVIVNGDNTSGKWNTSAYRLDASSAAELLLIYKAPICFNNLQLNNGSASGTSVYIPDWLSGDVVFSGCIFMGKSVSAFGGTVYFINCIFGGVGVEFRTNGSVYSSTVYRGNVTLSGSGKTLTCKNVLGNGTYEDFYAYNGTLVCYNCSSDDGTADDYGGSGNRVNQTYSFVSTTSPYDFHLTSSDAGAKDYGTDTSGDTAPLNFTTDIDGQTRSGTWDIGADEYVAAVTEIITKIILGD